MHYYNSSPRGPQHDANEIKRLASGRWSEILVRIGGVDAALLDGKHHPCPRCGGTDRFRLIDIEAGALFCNQCFVKKNSDGIAALSWLLNVNFSETMRRLCDFFGVSQNGFAKPAMAGSKPAAGDKTKFDFAKLRARPIDLARPPENAIELLDRQALEQWVATKPGVTLDACAAAGAMVCSWPAGAPSSQRCIVFRGYTVDDASTPVAALLYRADGQPFPPIGSLGERKTHLAGGSRESLIIVGSRAEFDAATTAWKCEGSTDALALASILPHGEIAFTNTCGAGSFPKGWHNAFASKRVRIIHDCDTPGRDGVAVAASRIGSRAAEILDIRLPYDIAPEHGKDLRDWLAGQGDAAEPEALHAELVAMGADAGAPATRKAKNATRTPAGDEAESIATERGRSDAAAAKRFVARYGLDVRYVGQWKKWLVWDGCRWALDSQHAVEALAKSSAAALWSEVRKLLNLFDDGGKSLMRFVCGANDARKIGDCLRMARSEPGMPISHDALDRHTLLLNCKNCVVDLTTGELRPHDRGLLLTQVCPVVYDSAATCPTWERFLGEVMQGDAELVEFLRRATGYSLTGNVREHALFFCHGSGANGKSVFLGAIQDLLGELSLKAPPNFMLAKRGETHPTELADLFGRRFVAAIEVEEGRRWDESLLKEATGGDRIRARRMREDFWEFSPTHKIWFAGNSKPVVRGTDHGIWRRIRLIPFERQFAPEEQDRNLPAKLRAELPGILAWAVRGCLAWQAGGLGEPEAVKQATGEYRAEMDLVGQFVADCCQVDSWCKDRASDLYAAYREWCERAGEHPVNQRTFGQSLTTRGFDRQKNNGVWYLGLQRMA